MAQPTPDLHKFAGIKKYLRTLPLQDLKDLSDSVFAAATEEVTITGTSADGSSANGEVTFPRWLYLDVLMDVRIEMGDFPVRADGTIPGRILGTRPDYSRTWSVT